MTSLVCANLIYGRSGMMALLLNVSWPSFVPDDAPRSMSYRALRGIVVTPEILGFEVTFDGVLTVA